MGRAAGMVGSLGLLLVVARSWASGGAAGLPGAPGVAAEPPAAGVAPVGAVLPGLPDVLPASVLPPATLDRIRAHLEAGDTARALDTALRLADGARWGRERDAAWMVIGMLHREASRHNLASEAFTQVRAGEGPLAPLAAFLEAEQDLLRGRPWATVKECEVIAQKQPGTDFAEDCVRLTALAQASLGNAGAARAAAVGYDDGHPFGTIAEQVEVRLATRLAAAKPEASVALWKQLAVNHDAPLTGRVAESRLAELAAAGVPGAELPSDPAARMARAVSLRDGGGRLDEAWGLFAALRDEAPRDPSIARWVAENAERFGWRTRHWDDLEAGYLRSYTERKDPNTAWNRYKVLVRGGRFDEASTWALEMQKAWGRGTSWSRAEEEIGRTMMLAHRYDDAVRQFDVVAGRGGWTGRRGAQLAAFATFAAGRAQDAVARYDKVLAADPDSAEAHYWRSRALSALERDDLATADREFVLTNEPYSWYATLFRQSDPDRPTAEPFARDGTWPGRAPPPPQPLAVLDLPTTRLGTAVAGHPTRATPVLGDANLAALVWPWERPSALPPTISVPWESPEDPIALPAAYRASVVFDPVSARQQFRSFADQNAASFPELAAIADLAAAGLYEESGTWFSSLYRDTRQRSAKGNRVARKLLDAGGDRWRTFFLATRDHHDTARTLYDTWEDVEDPTAKAELRRLGYPLAHDRYVWSRSRQHEIDPMLVLGLMRQESTYNARAVSRVGARGAMQIMPKTGHLMADIAHDTQFNAGDLSDPDVAIEYGIWYLGLLMERFDGVFPLAVASYNGGPHNVSSWLEGTTSEMPMDQFVEHIPFRETRDYVKKVSEGYAAYVSLYAPERSVIAVPAHPLGDHREVVDF